MTLLNPGILKTKIRYFRKETTRRDWFTWVFKTVLQHNSKISERSYVVL